jgi:hypothetical protein
VSRRSEPIGRTAGIRAPRFAVTDTNSPDALIARVQLGNRSLGRTGHFGSASLISAENVFPPIPSELIMPLDGFTVARDDIDTVGAVGVGRVGGIGVGSMLCLSPMDGRRWRVIVETQYRRNADRLNLVSNGVTGGLGLCRIYRGATFGYESCCSG